MTAPNYVRLTFRHNGRKRTVWAIANTPGAATRTFYRVNREGEKPDPVELIVTTLDEAQTEPAVMSRYYGMLMLPNDPDLAKE